MAAEDELGDMIDEEMHAELRDALMVILDSLAPLCRENRIKLLTCARQFFELPRSE